MWITVVTLGKIGRGSVISGTTALALEDESAFLSGVSPNPAGYRLDGVASRIEGFECSSK